MELDQVMCMLLRVLVFVSDLIPISTENRMKGLQDLAWTQDRMSKFFRLYHNNQTIKMLVLYNVPLSFLNKAAMQISLIRCVHELFTLKQLVICTGIVYIVRCVYEQYKRSSVCFHNFISFETLRWYVCILWPELFTFFTIIIQWILLL